ncbi:MAG TPA: hypothetical protein DDW90_08735 [Cyanobacteria bacterium UBA9971]|nr:hypothetical protein [Cyanobacteria bacterium UBA9971]
MDNKNIYTFNKGNGQVTIFDNSGYDTLIFGNSIVQADLEKYIFGNDLVVAIKDTNDKITIKNWFVNSNKFKIEEFKFADGSVQTLADIENNLIIEGSNSNNNIIFGTQYDDKIYTFGGNDTIDGGLGADTMIGGNANDTYYVDNTGDIVIEDLNKGTDTIISSVDYTLSANVENLILTDLAVSGTGNNLNNTIMGNSADNILNGGFGVNLIKGGNGNDTIIFTSNESWTAGWAAFNAGSPGNVGTGRIVSINTKFRSSNVFDGGEGYDKLVLTNKSDAIFLDDSYSRALQYGQRLISIEEIDAGAGDDVVDLTSDIYSIGDIAVLGGAGNDVIWSSSGNDNLIGNDGNDELFGGVGNDTLDGGAGSDTLIGGIGNDTYIVDNIGDVVIENTSEGTDTIKSSISYTLGANVENLTLTGIDAINATGNNLNNSIIGNSADNILDGGFGVDIMAGGVGNDIYYIDNVQDLIIENPNEGSDTVISSIDYTLSANVENLTLTGMANINATGNNLDNIITGNFADNIFDGGNGANLIKGEAGNDTINFTSNQSWTAGWAALNAGSPDNAGTGHLVDINGKLRSNNVFDGGDGYDKLILTDKSDVIFLDDSYSRTLQSGQRLISIEEIDAGSGDDVVDLTSAVYSIGDITIHGGSGNDVIWSSSGNDNLFGDDGNDELFGGVGNDIINGGTGADTLIGGSGNDTYVYNKGDGQDIIQETGGNDAIVLGAGISKDDLYYLQNNDSLIIRNKTNSDIITIQDWFKGSSQKVENLQFADGTSIIINPDQIPIRQTINEDNPLVMDVLKDVGYQLNIADISGAEHGTISLDQNNNLIYTPNANYNGTDSFSYTMSDGNGGTATKTINLTINPVNDAPVATVVLGTVDEDNSLILDILAGASDVDGNTLNISEFTQAENGIVSLNTDNKLVYTPSANYNGNDAFTYTISDGNGGFDTKTINLIINSVNDAPVYADTIQGTTSNDVLYSKGDNIAVYGNNGNDLIYDLEGNNYLDGENGNDFIYGGTGNDTLLGGVGNDILEGGAGDDIYIFNKGDGNDTIFDTSWNYGLVNAGNDTVKFGDGITLNDLEFKSNGVDLTITIKDTNDILTVKYHYTNSNTRIENFMFSDGSILTYEQVNNLLEKDGNDLANVIYGDSTKSNKIYGLGGDDTIYGGAVNDTISGGTGNDLIYGSSGDDTYIFNKGDGSDIISDYVWTNNAFADAGNDTVKFGAGITADDLSFVQNGSNLAIGIRDTGELLLTIKNEFGNPYQRVELFSFSDGSVLSFDDIYSMLDIYGTANADTLNGNNFNNYISGLNGNDVINAYNGNDTIVGGSGNDTLYGGSGDDTYFFNIGDNIDTIVDSFGNDSIELGNSVNKNNVAFFVNASGNFSIDYGNSTGVDKATVNNWNNKANQIEKIQLNDGTYLTNADINTIIQNMTAYATEQSLTLTSVSDVKNNSELMNLYVTNSWHA